MKYSKPWSVALILISMMGLGLFMMGCSDTTSREIAQVDGVSPSIENPGTDNPAFSIAEIPGDAIDSSVSTRGYAPVGPYGVPFLSQGQLPIGWINNNACGPTALAMAGGYAKRLSVSTSSIQNILGWLSVRYTGYSSKGTSYTTTAQIQRAAREMSVYRLTSATAFSGWSMSDLRGTLASGGGPVIVGVDMYYMPNSLSYKTKHLGHFVVVVGYDSASNFIINDPGRALNSGKGYRYTCSYAAFQLAFAARDRVGVKGFGR